MSESVPEGYVADHHAPDEFFVRCTECGRVSKTSDRMVAHDRAESHGLSCAQTGVTPVRELEDEDRATESGRERAMTDGGQPAPEHRAVDGGFECEECGATRSTPLGIARHRARHQQERGSR